MKQFFIFIKTGNGNSKGTGVIFPLGLHSAWLARTSRLTAGMSPLHFFNLPEFPLLLTDAPQFTGASRPLLPGPTPRRPTRNRPTLSLLYILLKPAVPPNV